MEATRIGRSRWAAIGAAVAVCLGAGGIGITQAATSSGERAIYKPIEPCRLIDTRPDTTVGARSTPLTAGDITLSGWGSVGNCTLPSGTTGLSLNVTAISPTLPTFLTLYPTGTTRTDASHLNPVPGDFATPNAVNVDLNATGQFNVFNLQGAVDVIIDVVGLYDDHDHDDRYYTKDQVDAAIATGGTPGDFYTEDEVDALLAAKANSANVYTQAQVDAMMPFAVQSDPVLNDLVNLGNVASGGTVVTSVTVDAPVAGHVTLNYSLWINNTGFVDPNDHDAARVGCSVGVGVTTFLPSSDGSVVADDAARLPISGTRVVSVGAGSTTFDLGCATLAGTGTPGAAHPTISALFTPAP